MMKELLRVLIVEDKQSDALLIVEEIKLGGYEVAFKRVEDEGAMKAALDQEEWGVIISDYSMPHFNAPAALQTLQDKHLDIPFIVVSGTIGEDVAVEMMQKGAHDYLMKGNLARLPVAIEREMREAVMRRERKQTREKLSISHKKIKRIFHETVEAMSIAVEKRDEYTAGHQKRVAEFAVTMGEELGYTEREAEGLFTAAALHDLGKICIPGSILNKQGKLTDEEFKLIKEHPAIGYDILKPIEFDYPVALCVLQHHERLDGSGYPSGISGKEIITGARILAIADVVEAISNSRPYRPALGTGAAIKEVNLNKGKLYDPDMVDIAVKLIKKNPACLLAGEKV
jgi:putative two-component system response regulator